MDTAVAAPRSFVWNGTFDATLLVAPIALGLLAAAVVTADPSLYAAVMVADVWFLGYSSEITCGVWAGFDKPRTPIYRGAFSNEVVLPVWTKLMSESFARYKPKDITAPSATPRPTGSRS